MQAMVIAKRSALGTIGTARESLPDPVPKPPGRPPGEPIIIKDPARPPEKPEIDGSLDEEDEPEIKKPPEIIPEKAPPPQPWERAKGFPGAASAGERQVPVTLVERPRNAGGVLRLRNLAMVENIRRAEDPAWRERLERQQVLARLGRMFGREEDPLQALQDHAVALKEELRGTPLPARPSSAGEKPGG